MGYVILAVLCVLCAGGLAYFLFRKGQMEDTPAETYVCDVCGLRECICHKEGADPEIGERGKEGFEKGDRGHSTL